MALQTVYTFMNVEISGISWKKCSPGSQYFYSFFLSRGLGLPGFFLFGFLVFHLDSNAYYLKVESMSCSNPIFLYRLKTKLVKQISDEAYWDCSVCTYRNTSEAFKCAMCDVRKGTSTRYMLHETCVHNLKFTCFLGIFAIKWFLSQQTMNCFLLNTGLSNCLRNVFFLINYVLLALSQLLVKSRFENARITRGNFL